MIGIRLGDIKSATGSAYIELNNTKVMAAVYGPIEPSTQQQESSLSGSIDCVIEDAWGVDITNESISHKLLHTFSSTVCHSVYFKTLIRVSITILERGDNLQDAATIAGSMALLDAGIEMKDFVVSCTCGLVDGNPIPFSPFKTSVRVAILPSKDEIVETEVIGKVSPEKLHEAVGKAIDGCKNLTEAIRKYLTENIK